MSKTLVFLETEAHLSEDVVTKLKARAEGELGPEYKVVVLMAGLRARIVPASTKAE